MYEQAMTNEKDMIVGNITRMILTNDPDELYAMNIRAIERIHNIARMKLINFEVAP